MANNSNPDLRWYPPEEPGDLPRTSDWKKLLTNYVWDLRASSQNMAESVTNISNNVVNLTAVINGGNSNSTSKPPVIFGTHALRLTAPYVPGNWTGYLYVETDRGQATYYSNGLAWVLIIGINAIGSGLGSFESRWTNLNNNDAGAFWIETSRNNVAGLPPFPEYRWDGNMWDFISGSFYRNQNQLTVLQNTFAANNSNNGNDVGALVNVIDYHHQLQWTATTANNNTTFAWAWGPQDDLRAGEGPIFREVDPSPLTGWQLYAGNNNVTYLKSDGTTGNVNLPNLSGNNAGNTAFLEAGSVNVGIIPPVAPVLTMNSYTPTGTISGGGGGSFTTANANAGNLGSFSYVDSVSFGGGGGTFTGDPAILTGNISNNGQPPSLVRRAWFRK